MFQSESFKQHRLLPKLQRVIKFFSGNFEKDARNLDDVDDENNWTLESVYPGILTNETLKKMRTRDKESFLKRCRDGIVKQFAKY